MDTVNEESDCVNLSTTNKEITNILQERLDFYTIENEKLENALKLLHIIDGNGELSNQETSKFINQLVDIQNKFGVERFNPTAMSMVHVEHMYNTDNISEQLQKHLNTQSKISAKILEDSEQIKRAAVNGEMQIVNIDIKSEEVQTLKSQLNKYELEIEKLEKCYPWLTDESCDLLAIADKTKDLRLLQNEEKKLLEELDGYKGLKPDLLEAQQQLAKIKAEYKSLSSKMLDFI